jgi:S1-C subfamily serine protease
VSEDRVAAVEMVRRTRQMGVPVIADTEEAIVGFDVPRLKRMAARHRSGGTLGVAVADATDEPGAKVGRVRPDTPAARCGVAVGDVIVEMSGRPVTSAAALEQIAARRPNGSPTSLVIVRDGERQTLIVQ